MNPDLKTQLGSLTLDFSAYGKLPIREDVLLAESGDGPLMKQWEKLQYIRKNLSILNRYVVSNKGEKIAVWLKDNKEGMSPVVLEKIGAHNDETGGISAYFFNLQNFYDEQEALYDSMEAKDKFPDDVKKIAYDLRRGRAEKRVARRVIRKGKMKDLVADNKGYLKYEIEEPTVVAVDGGEKAPAVVVPTEEEKKVGEAIVKSKKKIMIWIAGTLIAVTAIGFAVSKMGDKK